MKRLNEHSWIAAIGLGLVGSLLAVGFVTAAAQHPTKGSIPESAHQPGQPMDATKVPDFVATVDRSGKTVGYVSKADLFDPPTEPGFRGEALPMNVYADDLTTIVGHMFPDRGFVPLGASPESVPAASASVAPAP